MTNSDFATQLPSTRSRPAGKLIALAAVIAVALFGYWQFGELLSLDYLASKEESLREFRATNPLFVIGIAFGIFVIVTGLSMPGGAAVLTLACGWLFGLGPGILLVGLASTVGATLAFLLSRFFFRDFITSHFGDKLRGINEALAREGALYLFTLRLMPVLPFFMTNLLMGVTPVRMSTFCWVSLLGMLPGTAVFVYAGAQFPSLETLAEKGTTGILTPQLAIAFILLGLFPIVAKRIIARWRNQVPTP